MGKNSMNKRKPSKNKDKEKSNKSKKESLRKIEKNKTNKTSQTVSQKSDKSKKDSKKKSCKKEESKPQAGQKSGKSDKKAAKAGAASRNRKESKKEAAGSKNKAKACKKKSSETKKEGASPPSKQSVESDPEVEPAEEATEFEEGAEVEAPVEEVDNAKEDGAAAAQDEEAQQDEEATDDGVSSSEEEKPPEKGKLESTKPTINQTIKSKKEFPILYGEKIAKNEWEALNDEITDLNGGVGTLKHSYGNIIKSLMMLQGRRLKKKAKAKQEKTSFLTTISTMDMKVAPQNSCLVMEDKYAMELFLNPVTREDTFKQLFDEVDELNGKTEQLRTKCFDRRGNFVKEKFDKVGLKIERKEFNEYRLWTKKLASVIDEIARTYNDDVLNMFRLA